MNIKEAKEYIKDTVRLYLKKDEFGDYRLSVVKQRPVFMLGAPGIGKTAIMEQIASELGIALVSYSMTHHTRQSALGLPFIANKEYEGNSYSVSEYTMSEIIASIYDTMLESGIKEGILFLDEINCVSETLYPSMLQFLQYKVFGRHQVPEGWVIVTAGNPPEFNKAVREFDVVTMDRLKVLDVEPDFGAWKEYATQARVHSAILNFLETNREYFYNIETNADGKSYVTARGWEDLSEILYLYEDENIHVGESLIKQYLQNDKVVREFAAYYDLYNKYKETYKADLILKGEIREETIKRAQGAASDERFALEGLLIDKVKQSLYEVMNKADIFKSIIPKLKAAKENADCLSSLKNSRNALADEIKTKQRANSLTSAEKRVLKAEEVLLGEIISYVETALISNNSNDCAVSSMSECYNSKLSSFKEETVSAQSGIDNMFTFLDKAFGEDSNEMLVAVTELTVDKRAAEFLAAYGSDSYEKYNGVLMVDDREKKIRSDIATLL